MKILVGDGLFRVLGSGTRNEGALERIAHAVHKDVDPSEFGHRLVHHALHLVALGEVGCNGEHSPAGGLGNRRGGGLEVFRRARIDGQVGAGFGEDFGDALADAAAGAGDEGDFAGQVVLGECHVLVLLSGLRAARARSGCDYRRARVRVPAPRRMARKKRDCGMIIPLRIFAVPKSATRRRKGHRPRQSEITRRNPCPPHAIPCA